MHAKVVCQGLDISTSSFWGCYYSFIIFVTNDYLGEEVFDPFHVF